MDYLLELGANIHAVDDVSLQCDMIMYVKSTTAKDMHVQIKVIYEFVTLDAYCILTLSAACMAVITKG